MLPAVSSVQIADGERSVAVGSTLALSVTVESIGGASEEVTWSSDPESVATVSVAGVVTGVGVGEAHVSAASTFDGSKADSVMITVVAASPAPGVPDVISAATGDEQTAVVATPVAVPPSVRVADSESIPLEGVSVTFDVTVGGGGFVPITPVITDADGLATVVNWTLGSVAGENGLRATVTGSEPSMSVTFTATGTPGAPSPATSHVRAEPATLVADGRSTSLLTVRLADAFGNDITAGGAAVTFADPDDGSIGAVQDHGDGRYTATFTAGTTAGVVTLTPRVDGIDFANATSITLIAAPAVSSVVIDQEGPSLVVGDMMQLTVTVDAIGGASDSVSWESAFPGVASVHAATGLLAAHSVGTTSVSAVSTFDPARRDSVLVTVTAAPSGDLLWTRLISAEGEEEAAAGVAVDAEENVILMFDTTSDSWGRGPRYGIGMVVAKLDPTGVSQWYRQFGTSTNDRAGGVAVDPHGNVIVTGSTYGDLGGINAGGADVFITKFDADGYIQWSRQFGTEADDHGNGVAIDPEGNILVTGTTGGALGDPPHHSYEQCFLAKYDQDGNRLWILQFGTTLYEVAHSVAISPAGDIVVAGQRHRGGALWHFDPAGDQTWTIDLGTYTSVPGIAFDWVSQLLVAGSRVDVGPQFPSIATLAKYDQTGHLVWWRSLGPAEGSYGRGVATDQRGYALVVGTTYGSLGASNPDASAFLGKYDPDGNRVWVQQFQPDARFVAVDSGGNSLVVGSSDGDVYLRKFAP